MNRNDLAALLPAALLLGYAASAFFKSKRLPPSPSIPHSESIIPSVIAGIVTMIGAVGACVVFILELLGINTGIM